MSSHESAETRRARHQAAMAKVAAAPAEHVPRLVTSRQVGAQMHGQSLAGRFNNSLAVLVTRSVGTMWAAYVFAMISFVSFPQAFSAFRRGDMVTSISWLSQSFLQLVLLPIIMVGQNVISAAQDARAEADHETLTALHNINVRQLKLLEQQERILELLKQRAG